ncbi:hypothetical protein KUTeg_018016 [Tegillarca granosa]|uniref:UspA domain-containing protein n=1 Tax=Tegillarca granosa TaxID=220873 RepID=A0ABQ9EGM2_TEGGR|nr:hypothetical protein KUTeg_018016 [Tegillarca granosa]
MLSVKERRMADTTESDERVAIVAMDGSKHAEQAWQWFLENIHKEGDRCILLYCVDHPVWMPTDPHQIAQAYHEEERRAQRVLDKLKELVQQSSAKSEVVKAIGEPGETIVKKAEEIGAELIVVGCRGLGQIRRTFLGSVSDYVLHHSSVPVFVCRH